MRSKILFSILLFLLGANLGMAVTVYRYEQKMEVMRNRQRLMEGHTTHQESSDEEDNDEEIMPPEEVKIYKL